MEIPYKQDEISLRDVLVVLAETMPAAFGEVRFVARKIVSYFRRPAQEITVEAIKSGLKFFPLFLSYERFSLPVIDVLVGEAERLVSLAEIIQRSHPELTCAFGGGRASSAGQFPAPVQQSGENLLR